MHIAQIFQNLVKNKKPKSKSEFKSKSKSRSKIGFKWIAWSGIITVVGAGGWLIYMQNSSKSTDSVFAPIIKVERSNVENTVSEGGTLELGATRFCEL